MNLTRRELIASAGTASAGALGLRELVPEDWSDDVLIDTDYDRMEVGNAVFVSAYTDSGDSLSLEYKGPDMDEWSSVETVEDKGEKALSYGFHEEVDEPGDYTFRASAYRDGDLEASSDEDVVEFMDEIESGL